MGKLIQKEVDKQLESIQERKEENYNKILEEYFPKFQQKKSMRVWKLLVPTMAAVIILITSLSLIFNNVNKTPTEYFSDNEITTDATVEEVVKNSVSFCLNFDNVTIDNFKRIYDSISGDTLRFRVEFAKGDADIDLIYITNTKYKYEVNENLYDRKKEYQGIEVNYLYIYSSYQLTINAYFEKNGQKIIMTYNQRSMTNSEESFWTFIEEFVNVK